MLNKLASIFTVYSRTSPQFLLQSTWDQDRNHPKNTGSQNEQIKYTVRLIYKTMVMYLFHWWCDNKFNKQLLKLTIITMINN